MRFCSLWRLNFSIRNTIKFENRWTTHRFKLQNPTFRCLHGFYSLDSTTPSDLRPSSQGEETLGPATIFIPPLLLLLLLISSHITSDVVKSLIFILNLLFLQDSQVDLVLSCPADEASSYVKSKYVKISSSPSRLFICFSWTTLTWLLSLSNVASCGYCRLWLLSSEPGGENCELSLFSSSENLHSDHHRIFAVCGYSLCICEWVTHTVLWRWTPAGRLETGIRLTAVLWLID